MECIRSRSGLLRAGEFFFNYEDEAPTTPSTRSVTRSNTRQQCAPTTFKTTCEIEMKFQCPQCSNRGFIQVSKSPIILRCRHCQTTAQMITTFVAI
jgi:hypothetical protein